MALRIIADGKTVSLTAEEGERLTAAAVRAGLTLNTRCGGNGTCSGCRVDLLAGRFEVQGREVGADESVEPVRVRACQTRLRASDAAIRFPPSSVVESGAQIDDLFDLEKLDYTPRDHGLDDGPETACGVAVDIGTTTVVAVLVDLRAHHLLQKASMYNQQIGRADDVAARISYATTPEKVAELQRLVVQQTLNPLLGILCARAGIPHDRIRHLTVSGNTVMTHLFYGLSPESIGRIPFDPLMHHYPPQTGAELQLAMHPDGRVEAAPSVSGYIGGDIVSDLYVTGLAGRAETTALIDIGTNGEIVLCHDGELRACATAAGPAFEGAGLSCGCRAAEGAIERVTIDAADLAHCRVIGGGTPKGLCGSGVVDFMAEGLRTGLINERGRYDLDRLRAAGRYHAAGRTDQPLHAYLLAAPEESMTGEAVYLSEYHLAQVIKAKAAVFAGLQTLLETAGLAPADLQRILLAGGFARHLNLNHAIHIGLLPDLPLDCYEIVGNGSLAGAYLALVDAAAQPACAALITVPRVVELNRQPQFEGHFIDALALPHMDPGLFPGQAARAAAEPTSQGAST
jgi:uncharacterized 2Fe-2S/4Fe-4S cluster protein (DUF4445 family)